MGKDSESLDSTQELQDKIAELTEAKDFIELYISVINHDLFAPIKFINIIGDHLNTNKFTKTELLENFNLIINSTKRLELLCANLLELLSTTNTNESYSFEPVNIYTLVSGIRDFFQIGLKSKEIEFNNRIDPQLCLYTSESNLSVILSNLISNSIRFTQHGTITATTIILDNKITISISDSGKGINTEILEQLNNKNYKIDHKNSLKHRSYGFGYNLIFKLLPRINGEIFIESNSPGGTVVNLIIPHQKTRN